MYAVYEIDNDCEFLLEVFDYQREVAEFLNITPSHVSRAISEDYLVQRKYRIREVN